MFAWIYIEEVLFGCFGGLLGLAEVYKREIGKYEENSFDLAVL